MRFLFQPFYTLYVLLSFLLSLVIAFPFFLFIGMNDTPKARRIITAIVQYWSRGWLWVTGMRIRVSGHFPQGQKFIVVANHISYLDTINIYAAIPEYFRTLAKKEMAKVPVFGFVYKQLAILVDRSSPESRSKSMRLMWRQLRTECHITLFPEGTFNETGEPMKDLFEGAFRLALTTGVPILPLVFPDTVRRWHYSAWWKIWPGRNRAVFLHPTYMDGLSMKDMTMLKEKVKKQMGDALAGLSF
jgi:1-acyl-sn-glycerol-3-phosphate acyltransferase